MDRKEAIDKLQDLWNEVYNEDSDGYIYAVAIDMAIEALQTEKTLKTQLANCHKVILRRLNFNCTTEKPNDEVEQGNDVVVEPTDLISRADAIEAVENLQTEQWIDSDIDYNNGLQSAIAEIRALPSSDRPSGEWKPVSEELPQSVGSYIVTCKDEQGGGYVDYDYWTVLAEFKYNRDKVTAWIPFPKPYCCSYGERKDNIT